MGTIELILRKLREKGCIIQRNDGKWMGDWDEQVIPATNIRLMSAFGYIELVDRKKGSGDTYEAYVITDKGRNSLEVHEAAQSGSRLVK